MASSSFLQLESPDRRTTRNKLRANRNTPDEDVRYQYNGSSDEDEVQHVRKTTYTAAGMAGTRISTASSIFTAESSQSSTRKSKPNRVRSVTSPANALPAKSAATSSLASSTRASTRSPTSTTASFGLFHANTSNSTISTADTSFHRSVRSRSQTESSGNTSLSRPSMDSMYTTSRKSTSSYRAPMPRPPLQIYTRDRNQNQTAPASPESEFQPTFKPYSLPYSQSAAELGCISSPTQDCPPLPPASTPVPHYSTSGWKALARKASGKFRRSSSTQNISTAAASAGQTVSMDLSRSTSSSYVVNPPSPKPERSSSRSRSKTISAPSSDAETDGSSGSMFGGLLRKKSSNTLRNSAAAKKAWSELPSMPSHATSPISKSPSGPASPSAGAFPGGKLLRNKSSKMTLGRSRQRLDEVQISPFDVHFHASASSARPLQNAVSASEESEDEHRLQTPPVFRRSMSHDSAETAKRTSTNTLKLLTKSLSAGSSSTSGSSNPSLSSQALSPSLSTSTLASSPSSAWGDEDCPPVPVISIQQQRPALAVNQSGVKFPSFFNFVPRPEAEEDNFGAGASAASVPPPIGKDRKILNPPKRSESLGTQKSKKMTFEDLLNSKTTVKLSASTVL